MNRQASSRLSRNRARFRIAGWCGGIVSANPVVIRRAPAQSGHYSPGRVTNVEVVIPIDKTVKRAARGHVQQVSLRARYAGPRCHKTASRGRRRRNRFTLRWKFVRVWKLQRGLRFRAGLMPDRSNFELRCARRDRLALTTCARLQCQRVPGRRKQKQKFLCKISRRIPPQRGSPTLVRHSYCTSRKTGHAPTLIICTLFVVTSAHGADRICSGR